MFYISSCLCVCARVSDGDYVCMYICGRTNTMWRDVQVKHCDRMKRDECMSTGEGECWEVSDASPLVGTSIKPGHVVLTAAIQNKSTHL